MDRPWGPMDPNSRHQLWSRWTFEVSGKRPSLAAVKDNAARWLRKGFGSVGRAKVEELVHGWRITAEVEGVPAHDPGYVRSVRLDFEKKFVAAGWGQLAVGSVTVQILAGDLQDGRPAAQLVVMPRTCLDPDLKEAMPK